ncbi:MAG: class I SAM-dependent methyltransferase [Planctomycetes bacterium]|nr:class I SAM-dependent methyltransferase [Planctomycetota bacterium]
MADSDAMLVPTARTAEFVLAELPDRSRLLEVGCGDGRLAAVLCKHGHRVVAIDNDPRAVATANERGVDARVARFPDGPDGPFDAVLFTRSLHHVDDLADGLAAAARRLAPAGVVLVEDWAWEVMDEPLLAFCARLAAAARSLGGEVDDDWQPGAAGLAAWQHEHGDHGLHTGASIDAALRQRLANVGASAEPYAYRYLARYLAHVPGSEQAVASLLTAERAAISAGSIPALGRRWIARGPAVA